MKRIAVVWACCAAFAWGQGTDEWDRFFGGGSSGEPAVGFRSRDEVEAAWKTLLVGPRFERRDARALLVAAGGVAAPRLIPELQAESAEARRQAALTLGRIDTPEVRRALLACVTGRAARRDETRLRHAALALAELDERRAIPALLDQLGRVKRPLTRHALILTLARLGRGNPEIAEGIRRGRDRDRSLAGRTVLALALAELPEDTATERLLAGHRASRRETLRLAGYLASAALPAREARPRRGLANERDPRVLRAALLGIANGAFVDGGFVRKRLGHADPDVRRCAALARGRDATVAARDDLLARLARERDPDVRAAILFALRSFPDADVGRRLRAVLAARSSEPETRAALLALELGAPGAVDLAARVRARSAPRALALDLWLRRDPAAALDAVRALLETDEKGKRDRELVAHARKIRQEASRGEALARQLAAVRIQLAIDEAGLSVDWERARLAHALFLEVEALDRPLDGRDAVRVTPSGSLRPIPRMNKEEEDLRLWFDRHPWFDRRLAPEVAELGRTRR